ncbi:MAG: DUF4252 domain-containing protein [Muribaculaceae bacterium]|nr:DUF4252 domain-containing protein [Muribaculaceae bacterium]
MKKILSLLLSLLVVSCGLLHHNADDIINDMRDARHAQYVNVGSGLLGLGRMVSPTLAEASLGITSVQVLDLSRCNASDRDKFRKRVLDLTRNRSYEEIVTNQTGYETRTALVRRDGQYVNEIVLVNASQTSDVMLLIFGHINLENLERIINDKSNYFIN